MEPLSIRRRRTVSFHFAMNSAKQWQRQSGGKMKSGTKHIGIGVLTGLLLFAFTCTAALAQSTAQINGTVKDQSGAVLPGVEVTVTQTDTGLKRSIPTDETGSFI